MSKSFKYIPFDIDWEPICLLLPGLIFLLVLEIQRHIVWIATTLPSLLWMTSESMFGIGFWNLEIDFIDNLFYFWVSADFNQGKSS
jgi:hypothetical protein